MLRGRFWWTRSQHIRTLATVPLEIPLAEPGPEPVFRRIADEALELHDLGWSKDKIARHFKVAGRTAAKAITYACRKAGLPTRPGMPLGAFLYQRLAKRAAELRKLGWHVDAIAAELGVSSPTVRHALRWAKRNGGDA
jgi:hypothetical protein